MSTLAVDERAPIVTPSAPRAVGQLPGLDGVRGAAIIIVFLYHQNISWLPGGILTVSMFFTLSGYLITRLLVNEHGRTNRIDLRRFWTRRVRRLMPASLLVLAAVALLTWAFPNGTRPLSFADVLSGATYWENLHLIASGSNYEGISGIASPVLHMWSLSLEEQVYIVFPLLMIGLLAIPTVRRRAGSVLSLIAVGGFALGPILQDAYGTSVSYYATPVRAAEFLTGAAFAVFWGTSAATDRLIAILRTPAAQALSLVVLAFEVWLWIEVGLLTPWLFPWAVVASSLATCVIMGFSEAGGVMTKVLSFPLFRWLGVRVYGLYLVHWPVFRFITPRQLDVEPWLLFTVRVAVTLVISETMYRLIEDPVRRGQLWKGAKVWTYCAALLVVALVAGWFGRTTEAQQIVDTDYIALQRENLLGTPVNGPDAPTRSTIDQSLPARVLVVGDSQSFSVGSGMQPWATANGVDMRFNPGVGCGIGGVTPIKYLGVEKSEQEGCAAWASTRAEIVTRYNPQVVIIVGGLGDLSDRRVDDGEWHHIGEPVYDEWLRAQMAAFVDEMSATGATVVWFTHPDVDVPFQAGATGQPPFAENDSTRMALYNAMITELAEADERVVVADFAAAVRAVPGGQFDLDLRPDGTHIDMSKSPELIQFVADQIARAVSN
jgi:peptidoglycan/LPS O-acetylase OafA/YrhL